MCIKISEFKTNPGKYFELAKNDEVIVTCHGKRIGRIISEEKAAMTEKQRAVEELIGSVKFPKEYNDPNYDPNYELLREAAYKEKGMLR